MDHRQIELFLAITERLNLSHAAEAQGISQAGLSKSMYRLQQQIGTKLYDRSGRGIELTEAGRALARHARLIQQQLAEADAELRDLAQGILGHVRIGAGPSWLSRYLPDSITDILRSHPGLRFTVRGGMPEELTIRLKQGDLDVVIGGLPENRKDPDLRFTRLTADTTCLIMREGHELLSNRRPSLGDLVGRLWAMPQSHEALSRRWIRAFQEAGLPPPINAVETNSISLIFATLRRTDFLSMTTSQILNLEEAHGLSSLPCEALKFSREAGIVTRKDSSASPSLRLLTQSLRVISAKASKN